MLDIQSIISQMLGASGGEPEGDLAQQIAKMQSDPASEYQIGPLSMWQLSNGPSREVDPLANRGTGFGEAQAMQMLNRRFR